MQTHGRTIFGLRLTRTLLFAALVSISLTSAHAVVIPTVPVGDPGNAGDPDPFSDNLYGSVAYNYRIGTTEVTNAQYAEFLNAKAGSRDSLGLYHPYMSSDPRGGIRRSFSDGSYVVEPNMGNKPVNFVSWYDSIRFANWLHNGQGSGDTETGAYTLLGGTPIPSNYLTITRNPGATWFLPSENEWYKSAYYQPAAQGGDTDDYWLYPTASNSSPTIATATSVGDISNPGANVANYNIGADWNGHNGNVTTVGSAGVLSEGFYGTSDQGGNVWEWNEALLSDSRRGRRGGSWNFFDFTLQSSFRNFAFPSDEYPDIGFRVATVPEPSTYALAFLGILALLLARRKLG